MIPRAAVRWWPRCASGRAPAVIRRAALSCVALALAARAGAQDFAGPTPIGPPAGPAGFLERGLAPVRGSASLEFAHISLTGTPELTTRSLAVGAAFRGVAGAMGLSQTGDDVLGWEALALACGAARSDAAVALRALVRRDRSAEARLAPPDRGVGGEIGGGAWLRCGRALRVWASAPQLWRHGAAPPLARALELGARIGTPHLAAWLAREAAPAGWRIAGDHVGGVAIDAGPALLWLEARDRPLRGALGAAAQIGVVRVAAAVESHPVLGETARLSLAFGRGSGGSATAVSPAAADSLSGAVSP